ncbi:MAG: hypothetical protein ACRDHN_08880 [Thermomicrobiales bacterium]
MNGRRLLPAIFMVTCLALLAFAAIPRSAPAQDDLEARVAALETRVDEQGDVISALRRRVRDLEEQANSKETGDSSDDSGSSGSDASSGTTLSGTGSSVTDSIQLAAGNYRVTATVDAQTSFGGDGFAVWVYIGSDKDLLFNELLDENGPWEGSQVLEVSSSGSVYFEISNTESAWTLTIEPL